MLLPKNIEEEKKISKKNRKHSFCRHEPGLLEGEEDASGGGKLDDDDDGKSLLFDIGVGIDDDPISPPIEP